MDLEQALTPNKDSKQLHLLQSESGRLQVFKNDLYTWFSIDDVLQSAIENTPPYRPILPHCMVMLLPLLHDKTPTSILELGGGAQAMQRFLRHSFDNITFTSVELNPDIVNIARQYFPSELPLNIITDEAEHFLDKCIISHKHYDWLMVDLFIGDQSPVHTISVSLMNKFKQVIENDGWLIINCLSKESKILKHITSIIVEVFESMPVVLPVPQLQNHIFLLKKGSVHHFPSEVSDFDLAEQFI